MPALEIFHRDVGQPALLAHIIDGDDVRMIESAGGLRLAKKACARLGQLGIAEFAGQRNGLDRHHAIDGRVAPEVDRAHGAAPDLALELIAAEALRSRGGRQRRGGGLAGALGPRQVARRSARDVAGVAARRARFRFGALGIHQAPQARGDVPVGVVEARQVAVNGGGLRRPAALLQLVCQGVQIAQHGGVGLAALELGESLFEIVEQARGIGAHRLESWARARRADAAKRHHRSSALPRSGGHPRQPGPGVQMGDQPEQQARSQGPKPAIAAISPNLRMQ